MHPDGCRCLQPRRQCVEGRAARGEHGLHAAVQAGCQRIEAVMLSGLPIERRRDSALGERTEAVGEPGFRIRDAVEIDTGCPDAMAGTLRAIGHLRGGVYIWLL